MKCMYVCILTHGVAIKILHKKNVNLTQSCAHIFANFLCIKYLFCRLLKIFH